MKITSYDETAGKGNRRWDGMVRVVGYLRSVGYMYVVV